MGLQNFLDYGIEKKSLPDTNMGHVDKAVFKEIFTELF
jgi:hypothetical protein